MMKAQGVRKNVEKIILGIDPGTNVMGWGVLRTLGNRAEMISMGVIDMRKEGDAYIKLGHIFDRVTGIIESFHPDELAIEAPFFGKNVQSMLKLGRAQGVAIAAAIKRDLPIHEYEPRNIKVAITGNGAASKVQVAAMLGRLLKLSEEELQVQMDATDALGAAYCHFLQSHAPELERSFSSWKDFVAKNSDKIHR